MASFRTHISFGVALGVATVIATTSLALFPSPSVALYACLALAAVIGAILPDMDSDSGLPFTITFGSLSLIAGELAFLFALRSLPHDSWIVYAAPCFMILFVWFVLGGIFKRWTVHRGMAHSIPAAIITGLLLFLAVTHVGYSDWEAFLMGLSITAGYILHLILDEVNSLVNFHGTPFVPNAALGSALKFTSQDKRLTIATYAAISVLLVLNFDRLNPLVTTFVHAMQR